MDDWLERLQQAGRISEEHRGDKSRKKGSDSMEDGKQGGQRRESRGKSERAATAG